MAEETPPGRPDISNEFQQDYVYYGGSYPVGGQNQQLSSAQPARMIWLAVAILVGGFTGVAAGLLVFAAGNSVPVAGLACIGAFGGAVALMLAIFRFTTY